MAFVLAFFASRNTVERWTAGCGLKKQILGRVYEVLTFSRRPCIQFPRHQSNRFLASQAGSQFVLNVTPRTS